MKIFIDTNTYLDFYRSAELTGKILDELLKHKENLIFPEQVFNEFLRNRDSVINDILKDLKSVKLGPHVRKTIITHDLYNSLIKKRDEYNEEIQKVQSILENMKGNLDNDPIYEKIKILFKDSSLKPKNSDEALKLAVRRRDLGNPPRSPKKDTIGDEIIWESILNEVKDDLVFVTRDNGFFEGRLFLEREFSAKTNKKVMFKDKISSAISMIGVKLPKDVVDAETEYLKSFIPSGFTIMSDKDNYFVVSDGNKGGIVYKGYDIQNLCPNCGNYGPWNGVICMSCGMRSDPWD